MPNNNLEYHITQKMYWSEFVVKHQDWNQIIKPLSSMTDKALEPAKERVKNIQSRYVVYCILISAHESYWPAIYNLHGDQYEIIILWINDMEEKRRLTYRELRDHALARWLRPPRWLTTSDRMSDEETWINWMWRRFGDVKVYPSAYKLIDPDMKDDITVYIEDKKDKGLDLSNYLYLKITEWN